MVRTGYHLFFILIFFLSVPTFGQAPFTCRGQSFVIQEGTGELAEMAIDPGNNGLKFIPVNASLGVEIEALGFSSTSRLLYGIGKTSHNLYRIDADGVVENLGPLALGNNLDIIGGDISPDGRYFVAIGAAAGTQAMAKIDLDSPGFPITTLSLPASRRIIDIAFAPLDGKLYGYDNLNRSILTIDFNSGSITDNPPIQADNEIQGLFFTPFGELMAYGTSVFGVASALFRVDKSNGRETRIAAGPVHNVTDIAACPYTVAMRNTVQPAATFPCSEIRYVFTIGNGSGQAQAGATFDLRLPDGFQLLDITRNPFGGTLSTSGTPNQIRIENMTVPRRVDSLVALVEIGDVLGGDYRTQAMLSGLPDVMGGTRVSDNASTLAPGDSTSLQVNYIEEDSLYFSNFLCIGSSLALDASDYGNNLLWSTGSSSPEISVTEQGTYTLQAFSGCQTLSVTYEVTAASCPFKVQLGYKMLPEETFPCNEVTFRYIISNDSGLPRSGVGIADTLPAGFRAVRLEGNPFGGELEQGLPPGVINIRNLSVPVGTDSLDLVVEVGSVPSGNYGNRAVLYGLPQALGPLRFSDNPDTPAEDSTYLLVLGVESDSQYVERVLCPGETLILDGSPYGTSFLWENGSARARLPVTEPGEYKLAVFNGCEPSFVFFSVTEGPLIEIEWAEETIEIHLGEEFQLSPTLTNLGNALTLEWDSPSGGPLSCQDCLSPVAKPLDDILYTLRASNELCADTLQVAFLVDKTRRIYAPNAFSPNLDGRNDYFILQSPDFGIIRSLSVHDRWGGLVFRSDNAVMNEAPTGWDGQYKGKPAPTGAYLWTAEIEFIGEIVEVFSGEVVLLR